MADEALPRLDDDPASSRRFGSRPEVLEAEASARVGQILADKYKLEQVLGSGGMAHVYRATNTVIERTVAIKVLRSVHAKSGDIVQRFLREARTANLVQHRNVVDVIDVGQDTNGSPFIVQEYLQGETLLEYAHRIGGTVPLTDLMDIMGPVLSAIAEAHARGVVHRDIKPENIFLVTGRRGRRTPKVLDFGISKVRGADMTAVGMMLGTPAYMAPELTRSSKDADPRTDVWALGVVLFEMLTSRLPFEGDNVAQVLIAIASTDAKRLSDLRSDLPPALSRVIERCLRREADERYENATALALDLAAAVEEAKPGVSTNWSILPSAMEGDAPVLELQMPRAPAGNPDAITQTLVDPEPSGAAQAHAQMLEPIPKPARLPATAPPDEPAETPVIELRKAPEKTIEKLAKKHVDRKNVDRQTGKTRKRGKKSALRRVTANDVLVVSALLFFIATAVYVAVDMAR